MWGINHRMNMLESQITVCNDRNEDRVKKDNEVMLLLTKLSEGLANHGKREEELEKETHEALKETNATLHRLLTEITQMREATLIQYEKSQKEGYENTNKIMTHIRDKFESTEKATDRENSLRMQMNYMWTGLGLCVTSVIASAVLFGWLYTNVVAPSLPVKPPISVRFG